MKKIRAANFAVVRSPLLAFREFRPNKPTTPEQFDARIADLKTFVTQTIGLETALRVSSVSLTEAFFSGSHSTKDSALAVMRYLERMRGRATPFGLCAGYSIVSTTPATAENKTATVRLTARSDYEHHQRLDADAVESLVQQDPHAYDRLITSGCLLEKSHVFELLRRSDSTSTQYEIARNSAIDLVVQACRHPKYRAELLALLEPIEVDVEARRSFVEALIDSGLLIPAGSAVLTTDNELKAPHREGLLGTIRSVPAQRLANPAAIEDSRIHDLTKSVVSATLPLDVNRIDRVVRALAGSFPPPEDERLNTFRTWLFGRYDHTDIPLLEALDPEQGYEFPAAAPAVRSEAPAWLLNGLRECWMSGAEEWLLDSTKMTQGELAESGMVLLSQTAQGPSFHAFLAGPGTPLFARATAFNTDLRERARAWIADLANERAPEKLADIAFFLPGKSAAFTQFPTLTPWEITVAPASEHDPEYRLNLQDLVVGPGPHGSLLLRDRRDGAVVRPTICGAANPNRDDVPSFLRFLHALSNHSWGSSSLWRWGALSAAKSLPRVRIDGVIVSPKRWNLSAEETTCEDSIHDRWNLWQTLRARYSLPRYVAYREGQDLFLPVDLDDVLSVEAFVAVAKGRIELWEVFEPAAIEGPEGAFSHEIALPVHRDPSRRAAPFPLNIHDSSSLKLPGSDVLYLKIYGVPDQYPSLLNDRIFPFLEQKRAEGIIEDWFYLPFSDPDPHLRLRLFGAPENILPLLREFETGVDDLLRDRLIRRISVDTYDRETSRYGGPLGVVASERVFGLSTRMAIPGLLEFAEAGDSATLALEALTRAQMAFLGTLVATDREALTLLKVAIPRFERTRGADSIAARTFASEAFRAERASGSLPALEPNPEGFACVQEAIQHVDEKGRLAFLADLLHVHSVRVSTTWPSCGDIETRAYLLLEKRFQMRVALANKRDS